MTDIADRTDHAQRTAQTLRPPRFITFEGGEGAGKSTQQRLLVAALVQHGVRAVATREPGGSPHAERLREVLLSGRASALGSLGEAILFNAARIDHIDSFIQPALSQGDWVICDRFSDSTRAYQGAAGKTSTAVIAGLEKATLGDLRPDLTILMDLAPEIGLARAEGRGGAADRFEKEGLAFHLALRVAFLDIAMAEPERVYVVDATQPAHAIAKDIWTVIQARFLLASSLDVARSKDETKL